MPAQQRAGVTSRCPQRPGGRSRISAARIARSAQSSFGAADRHGAARRPRGAARAARRPWTPPSVPAAPSSQTGGRTSGKASVPSQACDAASPRPTAQANPQVSLLCAVLEPYRHVEGVVPVRDRLTYPQVGCRAHRPGPLLSRTSGGACSGIAWLRTVGEPRLSGWSASEQAYEVLVRLACPALEFRQSPPDLRPDLVTGVPGVIDAGDELPDTDAPKRRCLHLEVF